MFKTHSKFSYNLHILYYEILKDLINFKLYLNFFRILKLFGRTIMVVFPSKDVQNFFWSHGKCLKFR
jgi:hypothetical protein